MEIIDNILKWYLKKRGLSIVDTQRYILYAKQILVLPNNFKDTKIIRKDIQMANIVLVKDEEGSANVVVKNRWGRTGVIVS